MLPNSTCLSHLVVAANTSPPEGTRISLTTEYPYQGATASTLPLALDMRVDADRRAAVTATTRATTAPIAHQGDQWLTVGIEEPSRLCADAKTPIYAKSPMLKTAQVVIGRWIGRADRSHHTATAQGTSTPSAATTSPPIEAPTIPASARRPRAPTTRSSTDSARPAISCRRSRARASVAPPEDMNRPAL